MVKVLHIKSNVVTDNKPKLPTKEQIEYGEIAVNYAADHETISLRNSKDEIKTFSSDEYYTKQKLGTAFTDSTVTDVLNNELKTKLNVADFNSYSGNVSNNEQVIAGGISELKNEISGKQDKGNYALKGESYTKEESDTKYLAKTIYDAEKKNFATKEDIKGLSSSTAQTSYNDSQIKADIKALQDGKLDTTTYDSDKTTMNSKIDSKADKTTTYTKTDVDNLLDKKVNISDYKPLTSGNGIKIENNVISTTLDTTIFRFVNSLPTNGIEENKIYFVPSKVSGQNNTYTEYAYNKGAWEILGQYKADVDLAPYAKTSDVNDKLATKLDASTYTNDKGTFALKNDVVDKATYAAYTAATDTSIKDLGKVDDVKVNGDSVVKDKVATINLSPYATTANTYTKKEVDDKIPVLPKFRTINGRAITGDTTNITIEAGTSSTPYDDTDIKADIDKLKTGKLDSSAYTPYNDSQIKSDISALKTGKLDTTAYTPYNDTEIKSELAGKADTATTYTKTEVNSKLNTKLDTTAYTKVDTSAFAKTTDVDTKLANKVNTSDFNTYTAETATKLSNAGKIDDVQVNGTSVVTNKVANINLSSYAKTSDVTAALSKKQDVLTIDKELSKTSTNAVQNKVITTELENLMKAISGVLNDINDRLNTLSDTVAKQIKNSTE